MRDRHSSLLTSPSAPLFLTLVIAAAAGATGLATGCGGSGGITTDSVTMCSETACPSPRPASLSTICPDDSIAGPACIKRADGSCGWAVLTCPIERGPSGNAGMTGGGGGVGASGPGATGAGGSTGGAVSQTGGATGTGGYRSTGGASGGGGAFGGGGVIGGSDASGGSVDPGPIWGTGGNGSFSWTGNAQSRSTTGYYEENLTLSGASYLITIAADTDASSTPCSLTGQFPTVPPAPGTYPMADVTAPQADGTFVSRCATSGQPAAGGDESVSGQVVLSQSRPGIVEGSFTMHATRHNAGTGGAGVSVIYSGAFSVGCRDGRSSSDPACAARSIAP